LLKKSLSFSRVEKGIRQQIGKGEERNLDKYEMRTSNESIIINVHGATHVFLFYVIKKNIMVTR